MTGFGVMATKNGTNSYVPQYRLLGLRPRFGSRWTRKPSTFRSSEARVPASRLCWVRMIPEDIEQRRGVGVLHPHGDLIAEMALRLPENRVTDVAHFDSSEDETAIGGNIL